MRISDWSSDVCSSDLIAGQYSHNDGYRRNPETGIDTFGKVDAFGLRGTAALDLASNLELTVSGHYAKGDNVFPGRDLRGTRVPGDTGVRCPDPRDVFNGLCSTRTDFVHSSDDPRITYSVLDNPMRSEERRVGKECVSTCRS